MGAKTVRLAQYESGSVITLIEGKRHIGAIHYTQPSHRYRSTADYATLVTECRTYGDCALTETFNYLSATRR